MKLWIDGQLVFGQLYDGPKAVVAKHGERVRISTDATNGLSPDEMEQWHQMLDILLAVSRIAESREDWIEQARQVIG